MRAFLGIDIGTYESKGVLVDRDGTVLASAARPHRMLVPRPGFAEHRPMEDWWGDFVVICRELIAGSGIAPADIAGVGTSGIGPCMLPVDEAGEPLMNAVLYGVDTRAVREIDDLTRRIGETTILERCGNLLTSQSVGPKILWLKRNHPSIFARTRGILTSTSFLVRRLTGAAVIDHYTAANWSPLYLVDERRWGDDLAADIVPLDFLPELRWANEIAGVVTREAAEATGLAAGTPVIVGTVDAAAEAVSVGVLAEGDMMLMYGSALFMIQITGGRVRDRRLWSAPWIFPDQNAAMAMLATSGTITHWFRDQLARDLAPAAAMSTLAAEAAGSPPGARGLVFLPYLAGIQTPLHDTAARGAFFGLDLTHDRADLFRAVLEGIGCAARHIFETYAEAGHAPKALFAVGGGTRNRAWTEAISGITGMSQTVRSRTFGASYGDAFLAAHAVDGLPLATINDWNAVAETIVPDPETTGLYDRLYRAHRALTDRTLDIVRDLAPSGRDTEN